MRLPKNAKIRLAVSRGFPAFNYEDTPQDVASIVNLIADCSFSSKLRSIFGSMKEQSQQQ
jgi:hypothetical protein